jgi:hypothetical protein
MTKENKNLLALVLVLIALAMYFTSCTRKVWQCQTKQGQNCYIMHTEPINLTDSNTICK